MRFVDHRTVGGIRILYNAIARKRRKLLNEVKENTDSAQIIMLKKDRAKQYKYFASMLKQMVGDTAVTQSYLDTMSLDLTYDTYYKVCDELAFKAAAFKRRQEALIEEMAECKIEDCAKCKGRQTHIDYLSEFIEILEDIRGVY